MRLKARHILIRVVYEDGIPDHTAVLPQLAKQISLSAEHCLGDFGMISIRFGYQLKYFNSLTGLAILRVCRQYSESLVYSISQMRKLNGKNCKVDILHISGTINRCQQVAVELSRQYFKEQSYNLYLQSQSDNNNNNNNSQHQSTIVLASDGDIILDPQTIEKITMVEQEIAAIDAVQ